MNDKKEKYEELPREFKERMKLQLGSSYEDFIASYEKERTYGLRYNPLKIEKDRFLSVFEQMQVRLEPVAWAKEGFYYPKEAQPGKFALHEAGAYYIQEPSAMAVVELLEPEPGEKILDLCAAPGGKSAQIAGRMKGRGVLVSNEFVSSRAKTLSRNIERMGAANALVLNESPKHLAERFPLFFDRIVADAPCSGEGMFRKDGNARREWSPKQVEACAKRQREILSCAVKMLKPGGTLVYSTCTFAPLENEENTQWLVETYPDFELEKSMHIWPHKQKGEGHYAARFHKAGLLLAGRDAPGAEPYGKKAAGAKKSLYRQKKKSMLQTGKDPYQLLRQFLLEILSPKLADLCIAYISKEPMKRIVSFGGHLYLAVDGITELDGLKVERAGLQLGSIRKNRFEPSHALAMALRPEQVNRTLELEDPRRYLRGETVTCSGQKGWILVTVQGCSIGWGKASGGILKNHYPKGLRRITKNTPNLDSPNPWE